MFDQQIIKVQILIFSIPDILIFSPKLDLDKDPLNEESYNYTNVYLI